MIVAKATALEQQALAKLAEHATKKKWLNVNTTRAEGNTARATARTGEGSFILHAKLSDVQKILAKALKPNRKLVTSCASKTAR